MKLVVSSYNVDKFAASYIEIDLVKKTHQILDQIILNAPSFIIKGDDCLFTYSKPNKINHLSLIAYQIKDDHFVKIDEIIVPEKTLTHLAYSAKWQRLYGCSYLDGAYLKVDFKNHHFENLTYYKQELVPSKCHCCFFNEEETNLNIIDIEQALIYQYDMDLKLQNTIKLPNGSGPRHGLYHDGYIYVVTEYSNEVFVINPKSSHPLIEKISTLNGYQETSFGATLFITNDHLYASNRGMETIAVYIIKDHLLEYQKMLQVYGEHSRHMILSNDEKMIITFNKNSSNIVLIDLNSGSKVYELNYPNVSSGVQIL